MPFWAIYLQAQGYSPAQIGDLMALLAATKLISPNLWGWLADRTDRSMLLVRLSSVLTALSFAFFGQVTSYAWMILFTLLVGFFWNAPLPLFEAVTVSYLHQDAHGYSRIRVWGSIGFIVAVLALGHALDSFLLIDCLPPLILMLFIVMAVVTLLVPERSVQAYEGVASSLWRILRQFKVLAFFLVVMLVQISHGAYYVFFSIHLKDNGYDASQTGMLWALGVFAEILLFLVFRHVLRRFSLRRIMLVSVGMGVVRWLLIGWCVNSIPQLVFAQILHAVTFGAHHVVAIQLVHKYFAGPHHGKGQSLYSSMSYGLGGMLGSWYSGRLWAEWGAEVVYTLAAAASLLALFVVWAGVERGPNLSVAISSRRA